jgi:nucleoside-diphosphate-sugar epimerase
MPRVIVTGSQGKVGLRVVQAFNAQGWEVVATDVARGIFDTPNAADPWNYQQCNLTDAGEVFSMVMRFKPDAVVHIAAIPDIEHNAPHTIFSNNINATFNVVEACVQLGVSRLVNISSEQAPGFFSNHGPPAGAVCCPLYCPVDEEHPLAPSNPYALSKHFGEQLCDAAVRRTSGTKSSQIQIISIRPSWCQDERNIERNLGPLIRDLSIPQEGLWSYIDIYDLADAIVLSAAATTTGHEVLYIAAADNIGGRDMAKAITAQYGDKIELRKMSRPDSSGISCAKAKRLIGWEAKRSWRDYLDEQGNALSKKE